jgi:hypothetical protein
LDITTGLTAATTALGIVKDLREIDRSVDEASFKLAIADLTTALADAKISLADAKETLADKDRQIKQLQRDLDCATSGDRCPICKIGNLKTIKVSPHPIFGKSGLQEKHLSCDSSECSHTEKRMHAPTGILNKT